LFAWILAVKTKWNAVLTFCAVYVLSVLLFFNISSVNTAINPPAFIVKKQMEYLSLPAANTQIGLTPLQPSFKSFVSNAPQALGHVLLLPYPGAQPVNSLLPFSFELFFYLFLLIRLRFYVRKNSVKADMPFLLFALFFTFTVFLFIGYIVPNMGSLIRYRSLFFPFIITPLICGMEWKNIKIYL
jgi:hypothetical protein